MKTTLNLVLLTIIFPLLSFDMPKGWTTGQGVLDRYDVGLDKNAGRFGTDAGTIKCKKDKEDGFGTLFQDIIPDKYLGKRIKFTGYMKTKKVSDWAGFWLRVDQENCGDPLAFDNMYERSLKGTTDWTLCEIVLDVPINATNISMGALMGGTGQIWIDDMKFEIVDDKTPTTGKYNPKKPKVIKGNTEATNLNFDK